MDGTQLYSLEQYYWALTGILFSVKAVVSVETDSVTVTVRAPTLRGKRYRHSKH